MRVIWAGEDAGNNVVIKGQINLNGVVDIQIVEN